MSNKISYEEASSLLEDFNSDYKIVTPEKDWVNMTTKVKIRHINCPNPNQLDNTTVWEDSISHVIRSGRTCPQCRRLEKVTTKNGFTKYIGLTYSPEEFRDLFNERYSNNGEYELLSDYVNYKTKLKVRHNSSECIESLSD